MAQDEALRRLNPGAFAFVMATGIVSVAMDNHDATTPALVLFAIAVIGYVVLVAAYVWRAVRFRSEMLADLTDPERAFGFFTVIAATGVLGTRVELDDHHTAALVLLAVAWAGWVILGYVVPGALTVSHQGRPLIERVNGTWFIWVVASQSVAVLAAALEPTVDSGRRELALLAVFCWVVGVFLYVAVAVFVSIRFLLHELSPEDLTPPYWVAMGATAITVVAGARIVQMADAPMVRATSGLIAGTSVGFWVIGTWLIPPLLALGIWRHLVHRVPLRYEAALWSIVFPLGMYGVGGHYLGAADQLPLVRDIGANESWVALAVWCVVFVAMLGQGVRGIQAARLRR